MNGLLTNIRWGKVILAGLIYFIIALIARQVDIIFTVNYFKMPAYFGVWSKLLMPGTGPPPLKFYIVSILFSLLAGLTIAFVFEIIKEKLAVGYWKKVFEFTCLTILLNIVSFSLPVYLLFNVPIGLLLSWLVTNIVVIFLSTLAFAKILKINVGVIN